MFLIVTVTPGSTAPGLIASSTPVIVPVVSCADAAAPKAATSSIVSTSLRMLDLQWWSLRVRGMTTQAGAAYPLVTTRDKHSRTGVARYFRAPRYLGVEP